MFQINNISIYSVFYFKVLTEAETASVLMQVVNGLLYLKSNNILHRDMSLSNLLLTNDLKVKIADFGLATQLTQADEKHTTLCGTPNYISPEVASRAAHGLPVDVWGLGCMMYTLLVGKPPFDTDGIKSTLTRVVMVDYIVPNYLSIEAKDLLNRLLKKNPSDRIHIDEVLTHPFMLKYLITSTPKYNTTAVASVDSGLLTMSSGMISAQNITAKMEQTRSRSEDRCYLPQQNLQQQQQQHQSPNMQQNVFEHLKGKGSSLYNHYDSQYNEYQQPIASNEMTDRIGNMLLMPNEKQMYAGGCLVRPASSDMTDFSEDLVQRSPSVPLQENKFYGNQQNIGGPSPSHNQNFEPILSKHPNRTKISQKLTVPPINSERLLPTRFKTKSAILSILSTGEVVVELIKFKPKFNEDRVIDVCRISKDGLRIVVYQPDAGR